MLVSKEKSQQLIEGIQLLVQDAVAPVNEQRCDFRIPCFREVWIRDMDGEWIGGQSFSRDITPNGMGLVHSEPIDSDKLIVEVEIDSRQLWFEAGRIWTQKAGPGWYSTGIVFTGMVNG